MNLQTKYSKFRTRLTTDRNYISPDEELRLKAKQKKELEMEQERLQQEENERLQQEESLKNADENQFIDLMEELDEIPKHRKNDLKQFIKDNKEIINNIDYKYKEKLLRFIKEKYY